MPLRKANCYRKIVRAYTRKSKYQGRGFIKAPPVAKIVKYNMGDSKKSYKYKITLYTKEDIQVRHNALESVRQVINRKLQKTFGPIGYYLMINVYPHHVLRENKMLTGAGADRMQTGMQQAFGKPVGLAAQVKKNHPLFTAYINGNVDIIKYTFKRSSSRLPCKCGVKVEEIKNIQI